jgi:hypothetical protein
MELTLSKISLYELISLLFALVAIIRSYRSANRDGKKDRHKREINANIAQERLLKVIEHIRELPRVEIDLKNLNQFCLCLKEIDKMLIQYEKDITEDYPYPAKIITIGKIISIIELIKSSKNENLPDLFRKIRYLYQSFLNLIGPEFDNVESFRDGKKVVIIGGELRKTVFGEINFCFFYYHSLVMKTDSSYIN